MKYSILHTDATSSIDDKTFHHLQGWNGVALALHLIMAICILSLPETGTPTVPMYWYPRNLTGVTVHPEHLWNSQLGYLSIGFLFLAMINHGVCALAVPWYYREGLEQGVNPVRWAEYALSASLMHVMIAMLCGITSVALLVAVFGLTATTMAFGFLQEHVNREYHGLPAQKTLAPFWLGWVPYGVVWILLAAFFFDSLSRGDPPGWVWGVLAIEFITNCLFAVNLYLQQIEYGWWADYVHAEYAYLGLSFTAKLFLAWFNYGGSQSLDN